MEHLSNNTYCKMLGYEDVKEGASFLDSNKPSGPLSFLYLNNPAFNAMRDKKFHETILRLCIDYGDVIGFFTKSTNKIIALANLGYSYFSFLKIEFLLRIILEAKVIVKTKLKDLIDLAKFNIDMKKTAERYISISDPYLSFICFGDTIHNTEQRMEFFNMVRGIAWAQGRGFFCEVFTKEDGKFFRACGCLLIEHKKIEKRECRSWLYFHQPPEESISKFR